MSARDALRRAVAAEFQRLDAHDWGYDHGFCADPDSDEETAAFVDAAIRIVRQATFAEAIRVLHDIANKEDLFDDKGHIGNEATKQFLQGWVDKYVAWVKTHNG